MADFILEERLFERGITRGKRKGGDSGTQELVILNNIQRVDKFGAIKFPLYAYHQPLATIEKNDTA